MLILTLAFFCSATVLRLSNATRNLLFIAFLIITTGILVFNLKKRTEIKVNKTKNKIIKVFIILYMVMLLHSIIRICLNGLTTLIIENFVTIGMILVSLLLAFNTSEMFKEKNVNYILYAGLINYVIVIIGFTLKNGIEGLLNFQYLNDKFIDIGLETHELTFIFGLLLVYLLTETRKWNKSKVCKVVILCIFIYLGYKRILIGAVIAVLFFFVMEQFIKNKNKLLSIITIATFSIVIIYFLFSTVGLNKMESILAKFDINMMGRNNLYTYMEEKYEVSPFFIGNGIRSTEYYLQQNPRTVMYGAIHNDILRIYIENGLYIFLLYFATIIFIIPYLLKRYYNTDIAIKYSYLVLYTIICYTTDNLFTYYKYVFVFFAIMFFIIDNKGNIEIEERKIEDNRDENIANR